MARFTPTTQQVRDVYVRTVRDAFVASTGELEQEFDRWLDGVKAEAVARGAFLAGTDECDKGQ